MLRLSLLAFSVFMLFGCAEKEQVIIHHNDCPVLTKMPYDVNTSGLKNAPRTRLYKIILKQHYIIKYYEDEIDSAMKLRKL